MLTLSHSALLIIGEIGERREPAEACGIVIHAQQVIELPNRSLTPHSTFRMLMEDIAFELDRRKERLTEEQWLEMVIWHTHPGGLIGPSRTDIKNKVPRLRHLVVALTEDGPIPSYY